MRLYDTHCHFESANPIEIAATLRRAKAAGVEKLMAVGGSGELNLSAQLAVETREEGAKNGAVDLPEVYCALGYDRDQVGKPRSLPDCSSAKSVRAVGEIGLDYHYSPETREEQMKLFAEQLEESRTKNLPVVIHTREAAEDTIALLREIQCRGIIHCFTGNPEEAKAYLDLGYYVSFSGIVTFRAADNVRESARVVPDDRILIETDSPFLAPVPLRGQANEPAFIRHTCQFLAEFRKTPVDEFAELTFANAERILG